MNVDTACETQRTCHRGSEAPRISRRILCGSESLWLSPLCRNDRMSPAANGRRGAVRCGIDSHSEVNPRAMRGCRHSSSACSQPRPHFPQKAATLHTSRPSSPISGPGCRRWGLAFWTTELDPLERGYDGPIKMLVGMDPGLLTGIIVTEHHERTATSRSTVRNSPLSSGERTSAIRSRWVRTSMPFRGPPSP